MRQKDCSLTPAHFIRTPDTHRKLGTSNITFPLPRANIGVRIHKRRPRRIPSYAARRAPVKAGEDATSPSQICILKEKGVRSPQDAYPVLRRRDTELEVHVGGTRKRVLLRGKMAQYSRILERQRVPVGVERDVESNERKQSRISCEHGRWGQATRGGEEMTTVYAWERSHGKRISPTLRVRALVSTGTKSTFTKIQCRTRTA